MESTKLASWVNEKNTNAIAPKFFWIGFHVSQLNEIQWTLMTLPDAHMTMDLTDGYPSLLVGTSAQIPPFTFMFLGSLAPLTKCTTSIVLRKSSRADGFGNCHSFRSFPLICFPNLLFFYRQDILHLLEAPRPTVTLRTISRSPTMRTAFLPFSCTTLFQWCFLYMHLFVSYPRSVLYLLILLRFTPRFYLYINYFRGHSVTFVAL